MPRLARLILALILTVAGLTGCSAKGSASSVNVDLAVTSTAPAAPSELRVPLGTVVKLHVTSDVADELHVHGYERDATLTPGGSVDIEFTADMSGIYEVETHEVQAIWMKLIVE